MSHVLLTCSGWHTSAIWEFVQSRLTDLPIPSTAIDLASLDKSTYDMSEDVSAIQDAATRLCDAGNDVVLVLHSYTGMPGSEACRSLSKAERTAQGLPGGIVRLVFISAWIVPEGFESASRADDGHPDWSLVPSWMKVDREKGLTTLTRAAANEYMYNDLEEDEAQKWVSKLRQWSIGCSFRKATYAGWKVIPTTYVMCTKDQSFFKQVAPMLLAQAKATEPNCVDQVQELDAAHLPMLGQPEMVAKILRTAVSTG